MLTVVLAGVMTLQAAANDQVPKDDSAGPAGRVRSVVRTDERTGRLVRAVVATPGRIAAPQVRAMVEEAARNHAVNPELIESVMQVESNFDPYAVSRKGAEGLMQLMPSTAKRFGVKNSFDAKDNIEGGVRYLKYLQDTFGDDRLALAAYNAGEGAVTKYKGVPPYPETVHYVEKVGKRLGNAKRSAVRAADASVPPPDLPAEDRHPKLAQFVDAQGRLYITTQSAE